MSASVPQRMKALITEENKTTNVKEIEVPSIYDNEILVKTVAIALNPTDWKHIEFVTNPGTIVGCDFSGTVAKVGKNVTTLAIGDHVAGFVQGGTYDDRGAFAEYVKAEADLVWKVPEGTVSHVEAATYGCGLWTAAQALFHPSRLWLVEPPGTASVAEWVLVWGASTSVGLFAVQLVKLAGYRCVTTASPKNQPLAKDRGANAVFDYHDPDAIKKVVTATVDSIHKGLDTVSTQTTQEHVIKSFAPGEGKLIVLLNPSKAAQEIRPDVKIQHTLIYTSLGRAFDYRGTRYEAVPEDRAHMARFLKKLPDFVKSGALKPNPVKLWEGGLEAVKDGLQYIKDGKNSAEKIVYVLAEAPHCNSFK